MATHVKKFDVCLVDDPGGVIAVVIVQGEIYLDLPSILVIPLIAADSPLVIEEINPVFELAGRRLALKPEQTAGISPHQLGQKIASLAEQGLRVTNALDRLIAGF